MQSTTEPRNKKVLVAQGSSAKEERKSSTDSDDREWNELLESIAKTSKKSQAPHSNFAKEVKSSMESDDREWNEFLESVVKTSKKSQTPQGNSAKKEVKSSSTSVDNEWLKSATCGDNIKSNSQLPSQHNPEALNSLSLEYVQSLAGVAFTRLTHKQQVQLLEITRKRFEIWSQKRRLSSNKPPISPNKGSPTVSGNKRHLSMPPASVHPVPSDTPISMEMESFLVGKANSGKCPIEKGFVWSSTLPPIRCSAFQNKYSAPDLTSSFGSVSPGEHNGEEPVTLDYSDEEVFDEEQGKSSRDNGPMHAPKLLLKNVKQ